MIKASQGAELISWLERVKVWAEGSPHRMRLHRAFLSANECLAGESERLVHMLSRLGVWAEGIGADVRAGRVSPLELSEHLEKVADFGEFAFAQWTDTSECQAQFNAVLHDKLIPHFCSKRSRGFDPEGFRSKGTAVSDVDARDFLRAWNGGLIRQVSDGLYRAPKSAASEQFFWSGPKNPTPRHFTLWHEPIITVGALARLHWDYGWPKELIGTQSSDWAFDIVAFDPGCDGERIAGEVKRTVGEVDSLISNMQKFGASTDAAEPQSGKLRNAFKKVAALRARRAPIFWAIGPGGYTSVFQIQYSPTGQLTFQAASEQALAFGVLKWP